MNKTKKLSQIIITLVIGLFVITAISVLIWKVFINKSNVIAAPDYWPTSGWQRSTPERQGLDSAKLASGLIEMQQAGIPIHSLLIVINGYSVLDASFYPYDGNSPHNLGSITKSVITTLVGIAVEQGKLKLSDKMLSFFPEYTIANQSPEKNRITVEDLLKMSSGMQCVGLPSEATQREMESSLDWVQYALDRPMITPPGSTFVYCGPDIHLLSAILQAATEMTTFEYAQNNLFSPLGITEVLWPTDPQGINTGAGNIRLLPDDLAKLGFLYLHRGQWNGKQILAAAWVDASLKPQGYMGGDPYGYAWRVNNGDIGYEFYSEGMGGQRILVIPEINTILVTTGSGFDIDQVIPFIRPALVKVGKPIANNAQGLTNLKQVLDIAAQPPQSNAVSSLPEIVKDISGNTISFDENPLKIKSIRLKFNGTTEANVQFKFMDDSYSPWAAIGLNGVYRNTVGVGFDRAVRSPIEYEDQPVGILGNWINDKTFVIVYDTLTNRYVYRMEIIFSDARITVNLSEQVYGDKVTFSGIVRTP